MKRLLAFIFLAAVAAHAADVSGNWKATAQGPNGAMERTFMFKVEGSKLTGKTVSSFLGESVIEDGKVEGDTVTFTIKARFGDNDMKLDYKGKLSADGKQLKLTVDARGNTIEWTATRVP
jgi:hypothetical protein